LRRIRPVIQIHRCRIVVGMRQVHRSKAERVNAFPRSWFLR
jgi:hypothetical protein